MSFRENTLVDIQADLVARLNSDAYFADVSVIDERISDIDSEINKALGVISAKAGKRGACVVVLSPIATDQYPDNSFQGPLNVELAFRVLEHPTINDNATFGTRKEALSIARRVVRVMKHFVPGGYGQPLLPGNPVIRPASDEFAPVAYDVVFVTQEAVRQNEAKVSTPRIVAAYAPFSVSISTPTSDATIYYTLDGSYPWSGNSAAVLYSAAFVPEGADVLIRAAAFKGFYIPSDVAALRLESLGEEGGSELGLEGGGPLAP